MMKVRWYFHLRLAATLLVLFVSACGSHKTEDTTAPTVVATAPTNNATRAVNGAVVATFSETMNAATINASTFTVSDGTSNVAGSVTYAGTTATFTSSTGLAYSTTYTATITAGARDLAGNALTSAYSWTFTTGGWAMPELVETNTVDASNVEIAIDGNDRAIAVWHQFDGIRSTVWANRYTAASGWGTAQLIQVDGTKDAQYPQIAMDPNGDAIAVWFESDGTRTNIWANRYTASSGWGTAQLIETDNTGNAQDPQIAMDANGNAVAVWSQFDGTRVSIWSNRYIMGSGWGTAELIEVGNAGNAQGPQIAMNARGDAIVSWLQADGSSYNILTNRYTLGTGWGNAAILAAGVNVWAAPRVAIDRNGNAIVAWQLSNSIYAKHYTVDIGWDATGLIDTSAGYSLNPQIAFDPNGNAIAVWEHSDGTRYDIWTNRYNPASGWKTATLAETDTTGSATSPQIAIDTNGNAIAVWNQWDDGTRFDVWANGYSSGSGWGTAHLIETDNAGNAGYPKVIFDSHGDAIAVWHQFDGTRYNVLANHFR